MRTVEIAFVGIFATIAGIIGIFMTSDLSNHNNLLPFAGSIALLLIGLLGLSVIILHDGSASKSGV